MANKAEVNARRAIANSKRRKAGSAATDNAVNAILAGARVDSNPAPAEGEESGLSKFLEAPVIKQAIDLLSTGAYASANVGNEFVNGLKDIKDGNVAKGLGGVAWSPIEGALKGVSGGVTGNDDHTTLWSDVFDNAAGEVSQDDTAGKVVRGGAGFALDVLLDPLTYATLGGAAAVKGGVRAAQAAGTANKAEKVGHGAASAVRFEPQSRISAFKEGYKETKQKFDLSKKEDKQFRQSKRKLNKMTSDEQAAWLDENILGLRPAVANRLVEEVEAVEKAQKAASSKPSSTPEAPEKGDLSAAIDAPHIVDDVIKTTVPDEASIINNIFDGSKFTPGESSPFKPKGGEARLGEVKPPTLEARVLDRLADVRGTATPKSAEKADAPKEYDFDKFNKWVREMHKNKLPINRANGTVTSGTKLGRAFLSAKTPELKAQVIEELEPDMLSRFVKTPAAPVEEAVEELGTTGNIRNISKDVRDGNIDAKQFEDLAGTADPKEVAKFLDRIAKTTEFRQTDKQMRAYNTGARLGISRPEAGISGHSVLAKPSPRFSEADILASKVPATEAESMAFLEAKYTEVATNLSKHKLGPQLRSIADDVFYSGVGVQKLKGGPLTTRRGATTRGENMGAKFERMWNTHANIYPIGHIVNEARKLAPNNPGLRDDIIMTVMRDVDNRLRLAGIDPHLSNMKVSGDKTVVRLAPSDVFDSMPKEARKKYLWGTGKDGAIHEVLPTTVLDVAEVLVRSTTSLRPDGSVDLNAAIARAVDALNGTTGVKYGNRTIERNLDIQTEVKNWEQILVSVVGKDSEVYKKFLTNKKYDDRKKIMDALKQARPDAWRAASLKRLDSNLNGLLGVFIKGVKTGEPSVLSDIVATNMRNASVHSGNVARKVTQVSAEHAAKIMETFNTGTPSEFLNALVVTPPYPHNGKIDPAIFKVRDDLKLVAQSEVLSSAHEAKHFNSIGEPFKHASKPFVANEAAARNADAFQELPETTARIEMNPKEITPQTMDEMFDISVRETNIDVLYRAFGPSRYFNKRAGIGRSFETIAASSHAATHLMTGFHNVLRSWAARGITKEQARVAFKELQMHDGVTPLSDFGAEMQDFLKFMFSADPKANNFLTRNTVGPDHFNKVLKGIMDDDSIQVPVDATPQEMALVWKEWQVENPVDFFSKMMRAMVKTSEDVSMGASFTHKFGSKTPQPGYVKISNNAQNSEFYPLIDNNLYYPREVVDEIPFISRLMTESRTVKPGTGIHTFVTRVFDPVISNIKMTQTTLKPGHHVMSLAGDGLRNSMAGMGGSTKEYGSMWRVLHTQFGSMKGQDAMDKWAGVKNIVHDVEVGKNTNQRYETMIIGGKKVRVGHEDLYGIMQQKGVVLPPHLGGTDVDELADFDQFGSATNGLIRGIDKVTSGLNRVANPNHGKYNLNNFTAHRDSLMRGALFMHFAQSKPFKTLEEAAEYASIEVRKWAPTSADLGGFEAKYARRAFLYYTWLRGMLPRVIEGALTKPGVALVPSKAMYNIAAANGLDPSSLGDPFPEGSMFPSWYSEKVLGPQWESKEGDLWGINPTSPLLDVANSLGSGVSAKDLLTGAAIPKVGGTLLNMSTPWFKTPVELATGNKLDGGAPIKDKSIYLTDQIGPARVASRIAGKDLVPSITPDNGIGFANRTEAKYEGGLGDDFGANASHEVLNWLFGMGATNYTSDSATNSAKYEQSSKLKEERESSLRYGN